MVLLVKKLVGLWTRQGGTDVGSANFDFEDILAEGPEANVHISRTQSDSHGKVGLM